MAFERRLTGSLAIAVAMAIIGCDPKGTCERDTGELLICGDAGTEKLCTQAGGEFTADKTCGDLGYTCNEHGNDCSKKK